MTREEFEKKVQHLEEEYYYRRTQFTIDFFESVDEYLNREYKCDEVTDLGALSYKCDNILNIMRKDLPDFDFITILKYYISRRLKALGHVQIQTKHS